MSLPAKKQEAVAGVGAFFPDAADKLDWQTGSSRKIEPQAAMPVRWPKTTPERRAAFAAWHAAAMKIVGDAKASFRLMALVERFLHWQTGTFWATSATLGAHGGGCTERTIKRDIATYRDLGIFITEHGKRRDANGQWKKRRLVRLAYPIELSGQIPVLDDPSHGDTRCPHGCPENECCEGDTRCPSHGDTRCPLTFEQPMKGSGDDAA